CQPFQRDVILIPITADPVLAVGEVVLREAARPQRVVVPADAWLLGPVVRGMGVVLVEEAGEAGDGVLARPPQADDAQPRLGGERVFQMREVEGGGVTEEPRPARQAPAGEALADQAAAVVGLPGK